MCKDYYGTIHNCKIWKTKCSPIREWLFKLQNIHTTEYHAGIKKCRCLYWAWKDAQDRLFKQKYTLQINGEE